MTTNTDRTGDPEVFADIDAGLYAGGATDGLPVVEPTEDRVDAMLAGTPYAADTELGRLGDRQGVLTVEQVAVNGVMAGCLPVHMPVLVAGAAAFADPHTSTTEVLVGTDSSGHLIVINGPIQDDLDINRGTGAFGPGYRSNQVIGRALGLILQNTAVVRPGEQAMGVMGSPYKYSMVVGEHETPDRNPWDPLHVEHGLPREASAVTVTNPNCFVQTFPPERGAHPILTDLLANTPPQYSFRTSAVYAISPFNANDLGHLAKDEVKDYLWENSWIPAALHNEANPASYQPVEGEYQEPTTSPDQPQPRYQRLFNDPGDITLIVTGGVGKWNAVIGPLEGGPTTHEISLPDDWDGLLEAYRPLLERDWGPSDR